MSEQTATRWPTITPLAAPLGATVEGLDVDAIDDEVAATLRDAWRAHLVLFFPALGLTSAQQVRLAGVFGSRLAATTETGGIDHRGLPTLADEGFPEILVLETPAEHRSGSLTTNHFHTDVTFEPHPPIGSLFSMVTPADDGGDTIWTNQYRAYEGLSEPIRTLVEGLTALHGRPPLTSMTEHPIVQRNPETGRPLLFVNRGWTATIKGLAQGESRYILDLLCDRTERPEYQVRWKWSAGDAALWDNRCTMHYAVDDYQAYRRAHRVTIHEA